MQIKVINPDITAEEHEKRIIHITEEMLNIVKKKNKKESKTKK